MTAGDTKAKCLAKGKYIQDYSWQIQKQTLLGSSCGSRCCVCAFIFSSNPKHKPGTQDNFQIIPHFRFVLAQWSTKLSDHTSITVSDSRTLILKFIMIKFNSFYSCCCKKNTGGKSFIDLVQALPELWIMSRPYSGNGTRCETSVTSSVGSPCSQSDTSSSSRN